MRITVDIVDGPVPPVRPTEPGERGQAAGLVEATIGALLTFEGIVRADEGGRTLMALDYETYEPMAQEMLRSLAADVGARFGLISLSVIHSRGRVAVGGCSLRVEIGAAHRKEALEAMAAFIDLLKRDVPIWKHPVWPA